MARKEYYAFPKLWYYWSSTIRLFNVIIRTFVGETYPSAEIQAVYFTVPADWATGHLLESLTPLQRYSRCILQSQLTGPRILLRIFADLNSVAILIVSDFQFYLSSFQIQTETETLPWAPKVKSPHQIQFSVVLDPLCWRCSVFDLVDKFGCKQT